MLVKLRPGAKQLCAMNPSFSSFKQTAWSSRRQSQPKIKQFFCLNTLSLFWHLEQGSQSLELESQSLEQGSQTQIYAEGHILMKKETAGRSWKEKKHVSIMKDIKLNYNYTLFVPKT